MAARSISSVLVGAVLAAASGGLIAAGFVFLTADPAAMAESRSAPPMALPVIPETSPAEPLGVESLRRPLFHPGRRPIIDGSSPSVAFNDGQEPAQASGLTLKGIVITGDSSRAAFLTGGAGQAVWVNLGGEIEGWTVNEIHRDRVKISTGDETVEIRLYQDK